MGPSSRVSDQEREAVEAMLAAGQPVEPLDARRVFADLHDALFGEQSGGASVPLTLSRYVVLERVAAGGLGIVYAAYDPHLDRKVAIKLLYPSASDAPVAETHARLLREARVLARLAHPNVVAVHDVGTYDERELEALGSPRASGTAPSRGVFVVMELVAGVELGRWIAAARRDWTEIVDMFLQAGQGLAAAHAAGIVHRDFKPANVLVGDDGRARVLDFGLAQAEGTEHGEHRAAPSMLEPRLTQPGAVLGTPAYMAPEQHRGQPSDARSDEFAFFVALHEALHGSLPFQANDLDTLIEDKAAGHIFGEVNPKCPPALAKVIVRGLRADPSQRFGTMEDALVELRRVRLGWRRRGVAMAAAGGVLMLATLWAASGPTPQVCANASAEVQPSWDPQTQAAVRAGLLASPAPYAATTARSVQRSLDGYVAGLAEARTVLCRAKRDADPEGMIRIEHAESCLESRVARLHALTTLLREPDAALVERAVSAASALPPVSSCTATEPEGAPLDAPVQASIDEQIARAEALRSAARFREALVPARRAVATATELRDPAAMSATSRVLGLCLADAGDTVEAEQALHRAVVEAERAGLRSAAARALVEFVGVIVHAGGRYDEGERLAELAGAWLERRGLGDDLDARLALEVGRLRHAQGRNDEAFEALREALALTLSVWGAGHPRVADVFNELGNSLDRQGRYDEAMADYQRALSIREEVFGAEHPAVGASLNNIANIHASLGRFDEARRDYARALAIYEAALGPQHPRVAAVVNNIAIVADQLGQPEEALREHRRALAIRSATLEPDHPLLALDHNNIGTMLAKLGRPNEALAEYRLALESRERTLGSQHPDVAHTLDNIGITLGQLGQSAQGIEHARRGLEIREAAFGPQHPDVAASRRHLETLMRAAEAKPAAEAP